MNQHTTSSENLLYHAAIAKALQLWESLSSLGIKLGEDESVRKRIMLTNRLSILMFIFVSISVMVFSHYHKDSQLLWAIASINTIPLITLALNLFFKTNYSRFFLGVMTPIMVLAYIV